MEQMIGKVALHASQDKHLSTEQPIIDHNRWSSQDVVMNLNPGRPDPNPIPVGPRPILNYSIQTGEEFSLEFMRERANPRQQQPTPTPTPNFPEANIQTNPIDQLRKPITSVGVPIQTSLRNAASKLLCSYGGKVLPRPRDRKLRYVGGETKIVRISKSASWVELRKRTLSLYGEPHTIKYQLPGEDFDALITVSSDEDVRNMMEECRALDEGAEEKLRMFLFPNAEVGESQLVLESDGRGVDSEVEYVAAVNGMDIHASRRNSVVREGVDEYLVGLSKEAKASQSLAETQLQDKDLPERSNDCGERKHEEVSNNVSGDDDEDKVKSSGLKGYSDNWAGDESNEDNIPHPVFHSERLHREQSGTNRLSKSGDSTSPWLTDATHQKIKDLNTNMKPIVENAIDLPQATGVNPTHDVEKLVQNSNVFHNPENPIDNKPVLVQIGTATPIMSNRKEDDSHDKAFITGATNAVHNDILIDINDRFPRDFLSEMAQTDFRTDHSRLDVSSLMDQDHHAFTSAQINADGRLSVDYGYPPSPATAKEPADKHDLTSKASSFSAKRPEKSIRQSVQSTHPMNSRTAESDYEADKRAAQPKHVPLLDLSQEALQIIKNADLEELRELGSGTYGTVYHGKWRGSEVAIKRIKKGCFMGRSSEQEKLAADFWHEANILSKLHHPNVVAFYGVVRDGPGGTLATVTEYMVNGSLRRALASKERHLNKHKRLLIAMDAAFGMEYLHSRNIVHFDLKCDNLLVNLKDPSRPVCKVGDFGLSKIKRNTLVTGGVRGTLPWMAPELLSGSSNKVSEKVDVFSFGIVLWEILTGEDPYANMHYGAIIGGIVNNTLRPPIPGYCDPDWRLLMEQCWAPDPRNRPSFAYIARQVRKMSDACLLTKAAQNQQSKA